MNIANLRKDAKYSLTTTTPDYGKMSIHLTLLRKQQIMDSQTIAFAVRCEGLTNPAPKMVSWHHHHSSQS